ncbi:sigma-70 family RNA polymerase sigma factor [Pontibacter mangrovi]|uniref:Sigma-70 family RNA polymerase sigma factor n=1 Tax=Pontibacter mangrovi TaxID=2589816 RepID=A0A501W5N4_9BACT|nr:sigma-70 family RNA polymerase sigma factor [Pontibacter mangrovi]TPE44919.1 sigma-70 family RNA polymerase sigma factor [Pontibacter mangrovi]
MYNFGHTLSYMTHQQQAEAFLQAATRHREQLTAYARSLTKCDEAAHDLFQDALLKCHDRILSCGFFGTAFVPYLVSAIKYNFYYAQREAVATVSLSDLQLATIPEEEGTAEEKQRRDALFTGIMTFVSSHYSQEDAAVWELYVNGLAYAEIVFATGYTYWKAVETVRRIKKSIKANFSL